MRLNRHAPLLQSSLKLFVGIGPPRSSQCLSLCLSYRHRHRRPYTHSSAPHPEEIAILGGGISGLASAHFITKEFPNSKITLYESGKELGGWIKSEKVTVPGGEVVFDYGPRTLRTTNALVTLQLISDLGLAPQVIYSSKSSPAAQNRYIYYPDQLNKLPASVADVNFSRLLQYLGTGLFGGAWKLLTEPFQPRRPDHIKDESVGDFISRRVDKRVADNLVSAVFHGIYAGDIYKLSARTLMAHAWNLEGLYGSVILAYATMASSNPSPLALMAPYTLEQYAAAQGEFNVDPEFRKVVRQQSTFFFKEGMQQLPLALADKLRSNPQVEILTDTPVRERHRVKGSPKIEIVAGPSSSPSTRTFDSVISTLPHQSLTPSVTTMVITFWYKNPNLVPTRGFGYLIPRTIPLEQNPERALGVIFDHEATSGQDSVPGTKLTVMLGGHWWDGWDEYPTRLEGQELARSLLRRHLGITAEPDEVRVALNENCIPQYTVGYKERAIELDAALRREFNGRLRVVGSQCNGVGVNDVIRGAWQVARNMRGGGWKGNQTGLEEQADTRPWVTAPLGLANDPYKSFS